MSPILVFGLLLFSHLTLVSAGHRDKCPPSFECGHLGSIHFPFTNAELQDCGLLPVYGCDLPPHEQRMIQLEKHGRHLELQYIFQAENSIVVFDHHLHDHWISNPCEAFNKNITLPQTSPLVSFYIKYNVTLFKCHRILNISPPNGFFNYTNCPDYDIFYANGSTKASPAPSRFSTCSVLQLPNKDLSDNKNILSFLSAQMVIKVQLSADFDNCFNHLGDHCRLDTNDNFYCDKAAGYKSRVLKLALGLGLGLSIGLLSILLMWQLRRWHCRLKYAFSDVQLQSTNNYASDPSFSADPESGRVYFGVPILSYRELEKATNNFDCSRELGNGGFGTVYYGRLQDGREVAVKRLYDHSYRRVEQFMNEIEILTRLRHQNLVSLYGCTSRHSRELLLVYEYISNGTVSSHLHGELVSRCLLPWLIRIKIAIQTATALAYLHASEIIHRDVKTNNILLDENFCVKVADFGLSRLFPNDVTHVSTAPQGTPGYVDPEYHRCYQLTSKSDVYSFGVVLIELISSMAAVDMSRHKDEINLADLAITKIQKSAFGELVDPSLGFESDNEVRKMIVSVAELAFQCLQRDKELRPSMDEVLEMLRRIESGKEDHGHMEEVDVHGAGVSYSGTIYPPSPPSPDCDGTGLLKNVESLPSPKAVIDKWHSDISNANV